MSTYEEFKDKYRGLSWDEIFDEAYKYAERINTLTPALRNLVAAAEPIETEGRVIIVIDRDPFKGQKFVRELRAAVTAAKEVLK